MVLSPCLMRLYTAAVGDAQSELYSPPQGFQINVFKRGKHNRLTIYLCRVF